MRKMISVTIALVALAIGGSAMSQSDIALPWLELRNGIHAYTGGDETFDIAVCDFARAWLRFVQNQQNGIRTDNDKHCTVKPKGLPVTIASDQFAKWDFENDSDYGVFIRTNNSSWSGWISSSQLDPQIPAHTKLMVNNVHAHMEVYLAPTQETAIGTFLDKSTILDKGTIVEVILESSSKEYLARNLYVSVNNGAGDIRKGWLHSYEVSLPDGKTLTFQPPTEYRFKPENVGSLKHGVDVNPPVGTSAAGIPNHTLGFSSSEAAKLTAAYNKFTSSRGFKSTMFLSRTDRDPGVTSFTYMLNDCVGLVGFAKDGENLNALTINATGCQSKENSAAILDLLAFIANQCSALEKRSDAERMIMAAFRTISANTSQSIELGTCKISMSHSDAVGLLVSVQ